MDIAVVTMLFFLSESIVPVAGNNISAPWLSVVIYGLKLNLLLVASSYKLFLCIEL